METTPPSQTATISEDEVRKIADLARLELTAEEVALYAAQLGQILGYVRKLSSLDTGSVEPMAHVFSLANVDREDEVTGSLPRERVLANAPDSDGMFYRVPRIIE